MARDMSWYVIYTNIKSEQRAHDGLVAQGFEVYLPLARRTVVVTRGRKRVKADVENPLFTRYLFIEDRPGFNWLSLRSTDGVESILQQGDRILTVPQSIIDRIKHAASMGQYDWTEKREPPLKKGEIVTITDGALATYSGSVDGVKRRKAGDIAQVVVEIFGRTTKVSIPVDELKRVA